MRCPEKLDILDGECSAIERFEIDTGYNDIASSDLRSDRLWKIEGQRNLVPGFQTEKGDVSVVFRPIATKPVTFDS